jgi:hypothetical protein
MDHDAFGEVVFGRQVAFARKVEFDGDILGFGEPEGMFVGRVDYALYGKAGWVQRHLDAFELLDVEGIEREHLHDGRPRYAKAEAVGVEVCNAHDHPRRIF